MSKIVIVEDEASLQVVLKEWLESESNQIITMGTGREALELIPRERPDLVLLDLILPEVNGYEVLRQLKANRGTKDIPVVVLTNLGDETERRQALALGAKDYLIKADFDLATVRAVIDKILNKTHAV